MSTDAHPTTDATTPPPAANGATLPQPSESLLAGMALAHALFELGKQFPEPVKGDLLPAARWYEANASALYEQYRGEFVAVMNGAVVGHGGNELQLRLDVARKYNVHPYSFLVELILPSIFE